MNSEYNTYYNELNDFSILQTINKNEKLFSMPTDYLITLPEVLVSRVYLDNLKAEDSYVVPQNYFSSFADTILNKIKNKETNSEEMETPVLNSISKENVYTVPNNYFIGIGENIVSKIGVNNNSETKIIPLHTKRRTWRMAVAAAVVSAIVLSAGLIWQKSSTPDKVHVSYAGNIQKELSNLSNQEIATYLDVPGGMDDDTSAFQPTQETKAELNAIPSQEVENYLETTPASY